MALSEVCIALAVAWIGWSSIALLNNYLIARRIGLPVVLEPMSSLNPAWLVFNQVLKLNPITSKVRDLILFFAPYSYMGFTFDQGHKLVEKHGKAFTLVSPGMLQIIIADPEAAHEIFSRVKDFVKPLTLYKPLEVFGANVNTVQGEDWPRHRRLTAPSFNEKTSSAVWDEATRQAKQMRTSWEAEGEQGTTKTYESAAKLAMDVLCVCGFGTNKVGEDSVRTGPHEMTYHEAVSFILEFFGITLLVPLDWLSMSFMPKLVKQYGVAVKEFRLYVSEMLERDMSQDNKTRSLLDNLRLASEAEQSMTMTGKKGLSNEEIYGNMFIFSLAGHETTANTIATTIMYLAIPKNHKYQTWIRDEIQEVMNMGGGTNDYDVMYPKLKRCLALMYETLRVHGSIVFMNRAANDRSQTLQIDGKPVVVPPHTYVLINNHGLQVNPDIWGADADQWRPERWIDEKGDFVEPRKGAFSAWADGPRNCVGKKFSQVEFVAAMAALFGDHEVNAIRNGSTPPGSMDIVLERMLVDSAIGSATLQPRTPKAVSLLWSEVC